MDVLVRHVNEERHCDVVLVDNLQDLAGVQERGVIGSVLAVRWSSRSPKINLYAYTQNSYDEPK